MVKDSRQMPPHPAPSLCSLLGWREKEVHVLLGAAEMAAGVGKVALP